MPHVREAWLTNATDPSVRDSADAYFRTVDSLTERQAKVVEDGAPTARVIRLRGHHYNFITNEADVLREMRAFLGKLQ